VATNICKAACAWTENVVLAGCQPTAAARRSRQESGKEKGAVKTQRQECRATIVLSAQSPLTNNFFFAMLLFNR